MKQIKNLIKYLLSDFAIYKLSKIKNKIISRDIVLKEQKNINIRKVFYSQFVKEGDLCFDVGANIGNRISPLLMLNAKIVAVEPQITCQKILKAKFGNKITLVPKGLGEKEEVRELYISNDSVLSSFSKEWIDSVKARFNESNWNTIEKVQMTTLDKLIENYGIPTFIKIDVEGFEFEVLKGLTKSINMISFEYCVPENTGKAIACIKRLTFINKNIECNYSINESMEFVSNNWITTDEMINILNSQQLIESEFGDIYIRSCKI